MKFANTVFFLFFVFISFSQTDYLKEIAIESCECADSLPLQLNTSERNMRLGLCMINACEPYSAELLRDHQIDLKRIDVQGEELGVLVGIKMATVCPEKLIQIVEDAAEDAVITEQLSSTGVVVGIDGEDFVCFTIKDVDGRKSKYYWLTYVESDLNLETTYKELIGRQVYFDYAVDDFYDARISGYRNVNYLISIDL